jgi:hypothetical protein
MLNMEDFYKDISSDAKPSDNTIEFLKKITGMSLNQFSIYTSELAWYFWGSPPEESRAN